jgi:hypothetical protein
MKSKRKEDTTVTDHIGDTHEMVKGYVEEVRMARTEEIRARRLLAFAPLGDNHHNAAACPYCTPRRAALSPSPAQQEPVPKQD